MSNKIHVLQVTILRYPEIAGGVDMMVYTLVEALKPNLDVSVFVPGSWDQTKLLVRKYSNTTVYSLRLRLPFYNKAHLKNFIAWLIEFPKTFFALQRMVKENKINLIHIHSAKDIHYYFIFLKWITGVNYVLTLHGSDVAFYDKQSFVERTLVKWLVKNADCINAVSRWLSELVNEKFPYSGNVSTIYNALNIQEIENDYQRFPVSQFDFPYFVIVGSFDPYKGHLAAIEAWNYLKYSHPDLHLVIAGEGVLHVEYEALIKLNGCQDKIHLIGQVSHSEVIGLFKFATGAIFPSFSEGFSYTLLEAGAVCSSVICTDIPAFLELVKHNKNGLVVPLNNPLAIADAVKIIHGNSEKAVEMAKALKTKIHQEFSADKMASEYMEIYKSVLRDF